MNNLSLEKNTNFTSVCIAPVLLLGCFMVPSLAILILWLSIILFLIGIFGIIAQNFTKLNIRKNYSILSASLCGSIATYFMTSGIFPPIGLIFAIYFLLHVAIFLDIKKRK